MDLNNAEKSTIGSGLKRVGKPKWTDRMEDFWNDRIMKRFIKANLFVICCVVAGILMVSFFVSVSFSLNLKVIELHQGCFILDHSHQVHE